MILPMPDVLYQILMLVFCVGALIAIFIHIRKSVATTQPKHLSTELSNLFPETREIATRDSLEHDVLCLLEHQALSGEELVEALSELKTYRQEVPPVYDFPLELSSWKTRLLPVLEILTSLEEKNFITGEVVGCLSITETGKAELKRITDPS